VILMGAGYFVRVVSSLNASRVRQDPAFSITMQYAGLLAKASKVISAVYRDLHVLHSPAVHIGIRAFHFECE